jgi:fibronectin-binding autotransporter adhesin
MTTNSWKSAISGDWTNAADWATGVVPSATDTVTVGVQGIYTITLYAEGVAAGLILNDSGLLFYEAGTLAVSGTTTLQAGTLDLAYGTLQGGTLALAGGSFETSGGTLSGVTVQNTLNLNANDAILFVQDGLVLQGAGGTGAGSVNLTGNNASLDFIGSQSLASASLTLGAFQGGVASLGIAHGFGATSGATLTLGPSVWVKETGGNAALVIGNALGGPLTDALINQGTMTATGGNFTISGPGIFYNQGDIGASGGAVLDIASAGMTNTGLIAVSDAILDFGGTFATRLLSNLGSLQLSQATVEIGGLDENAGATLTVSPTSSLGAISLAGTITGGTVADSGGGMSFGPGTGVLNGVAYQGTLSLAGASAAVTLTGNTSLTAGAVTGAGAALLFQGIESLGNATITLGNAGAAAELGTTDPFVASAATTATLTAHLVVQQAGLNAAVMANAQTPLPNVGLSDTLINQGLISGAISGGTLTLGGYGTFINAGTVTVGNGDTLVIDPYSFSNTGTISLSGGATAIIGAPANPWGLIPAWSNTGTIAASNATVVLAGTVHTGQIGRITDTGGTIALTGTLINTGSTLTLGSGGLLPALSLSGTIQGGTIVDTASLLTVGPGTAELYAVSYAGTLALTQSDAYLRIYGGLALAGLAEITGQGAILAFQGTQSFNATSVELGGSIDVTHDYTKAGGSTLTLGPSLVVTQAGELAAIGLAADLSTDGIVNQGTIAGGIYGGTLTLGGATFINQGHVSVSNGDTLSLKAAAFSNTGNLSISNATLSIGDTLTLAELGSLTLNDATIAIAGTLNNAGTTLDIGTGTAWGRIDLTGTIHGGTIMDLGQGLEAQGSADLDAVSYRGTINLGRPFEDLTISDGIHLADLTGTLACTMFVTGAADRVVATTNETLPNCNVYIGSNTVSYYGQRIPPPELDAGPGATLTVGGSTTIRSAGTYCTLGDAVLGNWTDTIANTGTILAATAGGTLNIAGSFFDNETSLLIGNSGNVLMSGVGFTNSGIVSVVLGSYFTMSLYDYYAAPDAGPYQVVNTGTIRMLGGVMAENTGGGAFPSVPIANLSGGLIQGLGSILAPVLNDGTIESKSGPALALEQGVTGTGTMLIDQACVLELNGAVVSSQTISFTSTGGTLKLDTPMNFSAAVANYGGSNLLDLSNSPVTAIGISSGTLVATTANGNFRLDTTGLIGGEVSVWSDGHAGSDIQFNAQKQGGPTLTITLNQPNMLFWASPVGDEFSGPTWEMNDITIWNWSTADSLDFTDMNEGTTSVSYTQGASAGTLTVTDGSKTGHIFLPGSFNGAGFHVGTDGHSGALITYT